MVAKESAGLLLYRWRARRAPDPSGLEVLLGHPGGPFWANRYDGAWTIPKGGIHPGETPLQSAIREFVEETGFAPCGPYLSLGSVTQRSGKVVHCWAFEGDCDPASLVSVMTSTEWPPRSGRHIDIPEIDRVAFFTIADGKKAINAAQAELLDRLAHRLMAGG